MEPLSLSIHCQVNVQFSPFLRLFPAHYATHKAIAENHAAIAATHAAILGFNSGFRHRARSFTTSLSATKAERSASAQYR